MTEAAANPCFPRLSAVTLGKIAAKVRVLPDRFIATGEAGSGIFSLDSRGLGRPSLPDFLPLSITLHHRKNYCPVGHLKEVIDKWYGQPAP